MNATPDNPGLKNWLAIMLLGVIWGSAFMSSKLALSGIGPWWVAALRVMIAALVLTLFAQVMGQSVSRIQGRRSWAFVIAYGVIATAMALALLSWAQQHVTSAFAGVSMGAIPLMVLPLAALFSKDEGIGPRRIAGFIVGFMGLAVLVGPVVFGSSGSDLEALGRLACVVTTFLYSVGSIITRRSPSMPPLAFSAATLLVGSVILLPLALYFEGPPPSLMNTAGYAVLYAALIPTAIGAVLRVNIIKSAGSVFMSLTSYMVPVWAVIIGMVLLGEQVSTQMVIGATLILAGIAVSQSRALLAMVRH